MGSLSSCGMSTPMRRTRSTCCARTTTGHATALGIEVPLGLLIAADEVIE